MADQGAGGGLDSGFMSNHGRNKSDAEPMPAKSATEINNNSQQESQTQQNPDKPRLGTEGPTSSPLSRTSSSCSHQSTATTTTTTTTTTVTQTQPSSHHSNSHSNTRPCSIRPAEVRVDPPVTRATLSELDVTKIVHNPKLRHDINFDPELHFRPNLDGEKGRRKQEKANQFWNAFREQLTEFVVDRDGFVGKYGQGDDWCLPLLLKAVKEIIQTLVPHRDREILNEGLNVGLLMQQFNRGIADLEKLASWLAGVLKLHCAPMRDEWVDEMYHELSNGNKNNDMEELVKGMRSLLSVLEAMKLDVANHQIRCLRPVLIEDTVHFEQRFFEKKIQSGKMPVEEARDWYHRDLDASRINLRVNAVQAQAFGETSDFFERLCRMILPSFASEKVPNTFIFDEERLLKHRSDMLDAINLEICMRVYEEELNTKAFSPAVPSYVADPEQTAGSRSSSELDLASGQGSRPSSLYATSDTSSSPRGSACLFAAQPVDFAEARIKSRKLYASLLALLHTAPSTSRPVHRWQTLAPSLALQVYRFLPNPQCTLEALEDRLRNEFKNNHGALHLQVERVFLGRLLSELSRRVKDFRNLSGVGLFSVGTSSRTQSRHGLRDLSGRPTTTREAREDAGIEEMATRLAHLGILHWRVWGELAYIEQDVDEMDLS